MAEEKKSREEIDSSPPVVHHYDDIQEYDNELPRWWLFTLYATVIFAALYWVVYHSLGALDLPNAAYAHELDIARAEEAKRIQQAGTITPEALITLSKDNATVDKGRETFKATCAQCHLENGAGKIGPNLTDNAWIHGGEPDQIYKTVNEGVPAKGMPAWGPQLGIDKTMSVVAYVLTLKNTNAPGGKEPQGNIEQK